MSSYGTKYKIERPDGKNSDYTKQYNPCFSAYTSSYVEYDPSEVFTVIVQKKYNTPDNDPYGGFCAHQPFSSKQVHEFIEGLNNDGFQIEIKENKSRYYLKFSCAHLFNKGGVRTLLDFLRLLWEGFADESQDSPQTALI